MVGEDDGVVGDFGKDDGEDVEDDGDNGYDEEDGVVLPAAEKWRPRLSLSFCNSRQRQLQAFFLFTREI